MSYYIINKREYYGPKTTWDYVRDERGDEIECDTIDEARTWIAEHTGGRYELSNGEATSPTYYVIGQYVRDWLDMDDGGKFDWPDSVEEQREICRNMQLPDEYNPEPYACGQCEGCLAWMDEQGLKYIIAHAEDAEDGLTSTVEETRTMLDVLHNGSWPVDACLRWNNRDDITIESGLIPNEYSHEIKNIKNDGACGWDFEDELTDNEISAALDFICATVEEVEP